MKINGKNFMLTYPDGNTRAFTLSYDDGTFQDKKVMDLCTKYGMGCTFAINSGFLDGSKFVFNHLGYDVNVERTTPGELPAMYKGFEVAGHTSTHPSLVTVSNEGIEKEIGESKDFLSSITGYEVRGLTYPNNSYDDRVIGQLRKYGVVYSRTTDATYDFGIPEDFLMWHPTIHDHDPRALELVDECVKSRKSGLKIFYAWGHAYEFDKPDPNFGGTQRWSDFEKLLAKVAGTKKFWCVSNIEVYDYITAVKSLEYGKNYVKNNSETDIYAKTDGKKTIIKAGGTLKF